MESGERVHVFRCCASGCLEEKRFTAAWLSELLHEGCIWTCSRCGLSQVAQLHLENSIYRGFIEEEGTPSSKGMIAGVSDDTRVRSDTKELKRVRLGRSTSNRNL